MTALLLSVSYSIYYILYNSVWTKSKRALTGRWMRGYWFGGFVLQQLRVIKFHTRAPESQSWPLSCWGQFHFRLNSCLWTARPV